MTHSKNLIREDAQPFGYWIEHTAPENPALAGPPMMIRYGSFVPASNHYKITPLYTHPAPDALRVAVEALREVSALRSNGHGDEWESGFTQATVRAADIADQALAALQAEQEPKGE